MDSGRPVGSDPSRGGRGFVVGCGAAAVATVCAVILTSAAFSPLMLIVPCIVAAAALVPLVLRRPLMALGVLAGVVTGVVGFLFLLGLMLWASN